MNANPIDEASDESNGGVVRPIYFPAEHRRLFGWLHMPVGPPVATVGMVICNPFGYEAICAHRSLRAFAQSAAETGVPALRFDYLGTGDSEDIDPLTDQLAAWSRDVVTAVDELRRRTGVTRVCLLGFRLGALVASLAAANCDAVKALIAVAPVISGRRYLRELRTIQMAAGRKEDASGADGARAMEVSGFTFSAATIAALTETDLATQNLPVSLEEVLVVDRRESPGARAWADALTQQSKRVHYAALPGFVRMMMTAPHLTLVPQPMIAETRDWLARIAAGEPKSGGESHTLRRVESESSECRLSFAAPNSGEMLTETMCRIPGEPKLFGIVTEPRSGEIRRMGVILLNAGATHHVGPNRMYVTLARRWAEQGCVVLRMDLGGLGDSPLVPGQEENEVYPANAVDQIRAAVDFMRSRYGATSIALGGLCSGAFHALRAAVANVGVTRIIMVNPLNFFWREGRTQQDLLQLGYIHNPKMYLRQNIPSRFWKKLLSGQVNVPRLAEIYAKYGYELMQWLVRDMARSLRLPLPRDLGNELENAAARGIGVVFVFGSGEPGIALLRHQAGSAVKRLAERCRIRTIDGADHIFSQGGPRAQLESIFSEELFARGVGTPNALGSADGSHGSEELAG